MENKNRTFILVTARTVLLTVIIIGAFLSTLLIVPLVYMILTK